MLVREFGATRFLDGDCPLVLEARSHAFFFNVGERMHLLEGKPERYSEESMLMELDPVLVLDDTQDLCGNRS
jgi:hypothetical protein